VHIAAALAGCVSAIKENQRFVRIVRPWTGFQKIEARDQVLYDDLQVLQKGA